MKPKSKKCSKCSKKIITPAYVGTECLCQRCWNREREAGRQRRRRRSWLDEYSKVASLVKSKA